MTWTALDTETGLATNARPVPQLVCASFANDSGVLLVHARDPILPRLAAGVLADGAVFAMAPFDLNVLIEAFPELDEHVHDAIECGRIRDVLTNEKYIDIAHGNHFRFGPYGLDAVALRRAGIRLDKSNRWRKRYIELLPYVIEAWPEDAQAYAQMDAWATWQTFKAQQREDPRIFVDVEARARFHFSLYRMTLEGVPTDPQRVAELKAQLERRMTWLGERGVEAGLARRQHKTERACVQPCPHISTSTKAIQAALQAMPGARIVRTKPTPKFPNGQIATSKKALEAAGIPRGKWDGDVFRDKSTGAIAHPLEIVRELKGVRAGYTKNIPVLEHPVIRTRYEELVASGRSSASGFKDEDESEDDDD